jgi:hypothetical protein
VGGSVLLPHRVEQALQLVVGHGFILVRASPGIAYTAAAVGTA